jgi:hypothetical protein
VSSTYRLELRRSKLTNVGEGSCTKEGQSFGKVLWNIHIPGKVHHFIWRACVEALPTR